MENDTLEKVCQEYVIYIENQKCNLALQKEKTKNFLLILKIWRINTLPILKNYACKAIDSSSSE